MKSKANEVLSSELEGLISKVSEWKTCLSVVRLDGAQKGSSYGSLSELDSEGLVHMYSALVSNV